jgi:hypothetical protein
VDAWGEERHRLPATWWCEDCAAPMAMPHLPGRILFTSPTIALDDPIRDQHWSCTWCQQAWWMLVEISERPELELAFCAHCDATSYTRWAL